MKRQCEHEWAMPHGDVKRCGKCGVQESSGLPDAFQKGFVKRQLGKRTPANEALRAALKSAKTAGRKRVNSKPVEQGGVRYQSSTEAKFHSYVQLGMIPEFRGSHVISQPVFKLDDDTKYTADFLISGWCVVEVKSGKNHETTGQPYAYWQEGARIRFKWARSRHPEYRFQVWVWDKRAAQFVKVEG